MADGNSLLKGDVLIITFSKHTKRIKLYYYHHEVDFKEVKNLPIVKNIAQLQPIIFQFIEDFLRSRIEIAFEQSDAIFNSEKLFLIQLSTNVLELFNLISLYISSLTTNAFGAFDNSFIFSL